MDVVTLTVLEHGWDPAAASGAGWQGVDTVMAGRSIHVARVSAPQPREPFRGIASARYMGAAAAEVVRHLYAAAFPGSGDDLFVRNSVALNMGQCSDADLEAMVWVVYEVYTRHHLCLPGADRHMRRLYAAVRLAGTRGPLPLARAAKIFTAHLTNE